MLPGGGGTGQVMEQGTGKLPGRCGNPTICGRAFPRCGLPASLGPRSIAGPAGPALGAPCKHPLLDISLSCQNSHALTHTDEHVWVLEHVPFSAAAPSRPASLYMCL